MKTKNTTCISFGSFVRHLRETAGFSQEELADRANVHRTYIGGIERGERNPTLITIHKIAEALGVPCARLLEDTQLK